ncbi:MAG: hypothetical protein HC817_14630 [Saprospiraceae bacterium]|nr:hypothetical protein [Saprospiraceae bacterium]
MIGKTYGGSRYETLNDALKTEDEGFLLIGSTNSPVSDEVTETPRGDSDFWLVRIDSTGQKLWDRRFGGNGSEICYGGIQNTEGYLLFGETNSGTSGDKTSTARGQSDFWLVQIRPDGTLVWEKRWVVPAEMWLIMALG